MVPYFLQPWLEELRVALFCDTDCARLLINIMSKLWVKGYTVYDILERDNLAIRLDQRDCHQNETKGDLRVPDQRWQWDGIFSGTQIRG